jgi:hypothetical protein
MRADRRHARRSAAQPGMLPAPLKTGHVDPKPCKPFIYGHFVHGRSLSIAVNEKWGDWEAESTAAHGGLEPLARRLQFVGRQ